MLKRLLTPDGRAVRRARPRPACCSATASSRRRCRWPSRFARRRAAGRAPNREAPPPTRRAAPRAGPHRGRVRAALRRPAPSDRPPIAAALPRSRRPTARSTRPRGSPIRGTSPKRRACCEEHLRAHGPSAQAFYLLGLVRDAAGNQAEAADVLPQGALSRSESPRRADPPRAAAGEAGRRAPGAQAAAQRARGSSEQRT